MTVLLCGNKLSGHIVSSLVGDLTLVHHFPSGNQPLQASVVVKFKGGIIFIVQYVSRMDNTSKRVAADGLIMAQIL